MAEILEFEPPVNPQAIAFFDGQNIYRAVLKRFGCTHPDYDPKALAQEICTAKGWVLKETRFYTGVPLITDDPSWHHFWRAKLLQMQLDLIYVFSKPLRGGREKGIDVRIAIDIVKMARRRLYDVALIFSEDQDFAEVAEEIRAIAQEQARWIKAASAFPCPVGVSVRGIDKTDWIKIDKPTYDLCIDPKDYRPTTP
jgi:uncharacterized LabA/DUF88 family protein